MQNISPLLAMPPELRHKILGHISNSPMDLKIYETASPPHTVLDVYNLNTDHYRNVGHIYSLLIALTNAGVFSTDSPLLKNVIKGLGVFDDISWNTFMADVSREKLTQTQRHSIRYGIFPTKYIDRPSTNLLDLQNELKRKMYVTLPLLDKQIKVIAPDGYGIIANPWFSTRNDYIKLMNSLPIN